MKIAISLLCAALANAALALTIEMAPSQESVKVKADRVNLRGRPDANGEVVGQVAAGEVLKLVQPGDVWVGVAPPEKVKSWIHKDFIQDGKVSVKELSVRAGPSINYPRIGSLFRGDSVTATETFGEWMCVAPPTNAVVWAHRELLDMGSVARAASPPIIPALQTASPATSSAPSTIIIPLDRPTHGTPPTAETTSEPQRIAPSIPGIGIPEPTSVPQPHDSVVMPPRYAPGTGTNVLTTVAPPEDLKLIPIPGQGSVTQYEGFVKSAPYFLAPGRYRLANKRGGNLETVCFLRGNSQQLSTLQDQFLAIGGRQYWVHGVREPVLVIERIERKPEPALP